MVRRYISMPFARRSALSSPPTSEAAWKRGSNAAASRPPRSSRRIPGNRDSPRGSPWRPRSTTSACRARCRRDARRCPCRMRRRLRAKLVETDELVAEQELVRRVDRRVHEPHEREYEVLRDELAAHALERRIGCEVDAFADSHRPRLRVVFGDRQRFGCERHDLRRPREIVVRQQPIEHELENARRRRAGRARRIEPGRLVAQHAMPDLFRIGCERARWRADDDQREQRNTKSARSYGNCRRCPCGHGAGEASGLPFSTIYTATAFAGRSPLRPSCTAPAATLYDSPGFNASGASPSTSSVSMPSTT